MCRYLFVNFSFQKKKREEREIFVNLLTFGKGTKLLVFVQFSILFKVGDKKRKKRRKKTINKQINMVSARLHKNFLLVWIRHIRVKRYVTLL